MKKVLMMLSIAAYLTAAMNVQANAEPEATSQEAAPCTNGFDSVNVCQILS